MNSNSQNFIEQFEQQTDRNKPIPINTTINALGNELLQLWILAAYRIGYRM